MVVFWGKIVFVLRESPSGKASAFQADIRGFESRLPLWFGDRYTGGGCQYSAAGGPAAGYWSLYAQGSMEETGSWRSG